MKPVKRICGNCNLRGCGLTREEDDCTLFEVYGHIYKAEVERLERVLAEIEERVDYKCSFCKHGQLQAQDEPCYSCESSSNFEFPDGAVA